MVNAKKSITKNAYGSVALSQAFVFYNAGVRYFTILSS